MFYENDIRDDKTRFKEMMSGPNPADVWRLLAKEMAAKCDQQEAEVTRLRGLIADLRRVWHAGVDLDKNAISQEALRVFIEAERPYT